jgi:16S rRNA pseudouridine516 synthase
MLLLTNDTRFGERVTGPEERVEKTYEVRLDRPLEASDAEAFRRGLLLEEGKRSRPASVSVSRGDPSTCTVTLTEGKNRQIRRMFELLGYGVVHLRRSIIGPVALGSLQEGQLRPLTPPEVGGFGRKGGKGVRR